MILVRLYFIKIILILGGFWAVDVEAVMLIAEEGRELEIQCSHTNAHGNIKYFCKSPCYDDRDILIRSKQKDQNSRYNIRDTGNTFYVTITDLTRGDSGEYWCGVERVGKDTYNYVLINVTPRIIKASSSNASEQNKTSPETLLYIGVSLGALLFILLIAVVVFIKHRHQDIPKPMGDNMTLSDTFQYSNQSSEPGPSTAQNHSVIQEPTSDIYANVHTEGESYSSVFFTKHRRTSVTRADPESEAVYSQVKT